MTWGLGACVAAGPRAAGGTTLRIVELSWFRHMVVMFAA